MKNKYEKYYYLIENILVLPTKEEVEIMIEKARQEIKEKNRLADEESKLQHEKYIKEYLPIYSQRTIKEINKAVENGNKKAYVRIDFDLIHIIKEYIENKYKYKCKIIKQKTYYNDFYELYIKLG